jgi:hypothetical protein
MFEKVGGDKRGDTVQGISQAIGGSDEKGI